MQAVMIDPIAQAFSEGSDARIRGALPRENPYPAGARAKAWEDGWFDVDEAWPAARPLPEVSL